MTRSVVFLNERDYYNNCTNMVNVSDRYFRENATLTFYCKLPIPKYWCFHLYDIFVMEEGIHYSK